MLVIPVAVHVLRVVVTLKDIVRNESGLWNVPL